MKNSKWVRAASLATLWGCAWAHAQGQAGAPVVPPDSAASAETAAPTPTAAAASSPEVPPAAAASAAASTSATSAAPTVLPPVLVTSGRAASPVSKLVMTGDELRSVPGAGGDPMKALQSLPGVAVADDASGAPAIRGARPNDNAYYIDDLPVGYLFHVGGLVSVVHADLVQQFDLYSAAFGPEYADAIGAVLDVTLRKPRTDRLGGTLNVSLLGADALVEGPVSENQSFYFAVKRSYLDLMLKTVEDEDTGVVVTVPRYYDYQAKYLWQLNEQHRLTFHATGAADTLEFQVPQASTVAQQDPVLAGDGADKTAYSGQALVWDAALGGGMSNKLALGHLVNRQASNVGSALRLTATGTSTYLREQFRFRPARQHELLLGTDLEANRADIDLDVRNARCTEFDPQCDYTSAGRVQVRDSVGVNFTSVFARDRWQLSPDWALVAGVRHSRDNYLQRRYTEPRLALEWQLNERTLITAGWGRHHQFPPGEQVLQGIGNPGLAHVRSTHRVLGVSQELDAGWSWKLEGYEKTFDDFAVSDPLRNYINGASGQARGLELLVKKDPKASRWSGWFSLSLSRARRQNDVSGQEFPFDFDQPVIATLVGQYKLSDRWQLGARWSYHTGSPDTPIVGSTVDGDGRVRPIYGGLNSERLPAYHRLDLRADKTLSPTTKFYGELINAYARKNVSGYSYAADYSSRKPVQQLPLLVSFGWMINF